MTTPSLPVRVRRRALRLVLSAKRSHSDWARSWMMKVATSSAKTLGAGGFTGLGEASAEGLATSAVGVEGAGAVVSGGGAWAPEDGTVTWS